MIEGRKRPGLAAVAAGGVGAALLMSLSLNGAVAAPTPAPATNNSKCAPVDGVTPTSIKFATIMSVTGANAANFKGFNEAVNLRLSQENAKGGIFGRKLTSVLMDDASSGATQTTVATKAIQEEKAFAVIQETTSDTMMALFRAANMPVIGINNGTGSQNDRNSFFATGYANSAVHR